MTRDGGVFTTYTRHGVERTGSLALSWEVLGDPISDDFDPDQSPAATVWRAWRRQYPADVLPIYWFIQGSAGIFEAAPGCGYSLDEDFLKYYSWPTDAAGQPIRWVDLPVMDKLWRPGRGNKGGFIQELTGWKPSPFQSRMDVALIERLTARTTDRVAQ